MEKMVSQLTLAKVLEGLFEPIGFSKVYQIDEKWLLSELAATPDVFVAEDILTFEKELKNEQTKYILVSSDLINKVALERILTRQQRGCVVFYGSL